MSFGQRVGSKSNQRWTWLANEKKNESELSQRMIKDKTELLDWVLDEVSDTFSHFVLGFYEWDSGM